jgi:hypothetical protein
MQLAVVDNAVEFVRSHPGFFFRGDPEPMACVQQLVAEVLALGGHEVTVRREGTWWLVSSTFDWLRPAPGLTVMDLFQRLIPLPELGPNTSRVEVALVAFARRVATVGTGEERLVVTGEPPSEDLWRWISNPPAGRTVAFSFAG